MTDDRDDDAPAPTRRPARVDPNEPAADLAFEQTPARGSVRKVAQYQKAVIYCLLGQLLVGCLVGTLAIVLDGGGGGGAAGEFGAADAALLLVALAAVVLWLASAVFVGLLAAELFGGGLGVVLGLLALFGCVGSLVLLIVNQFATNRLKEAGLKVGLMGADTSRL